MFGASPMALTLLSKLGDYLQSAVKRAVLQVAQGSKPDPDQIALWLEDQMKDWNPKLKGRKLSDTATKKAAARFIAGVACNFADPQQTTEIP